MKMAQRSKLSQMSNIKKDVLLAPKAEKIEMTLNTESSIASGLLIQRLTELYEDPIEASVRETVSNALDAVTEEHSGSTPEVHISKPSALNPIMVIEDNGVGMDYDDLKNIYSKYGASTKAENLEQIGAYGLGAKSPLAYGTEFTVSSVRNGQKTTIIVAREEMTNYIKVIDNVLTDEPTGTTVSIPVNSRDIDRFNENIDKYIETPLDKNIDLYINGKIVENNEFIVLTENALILDGTEKVYGRIWAKKDKLSKLITNTDESDVKKGTRYLIGGWAYNSPAKRNSYWGSNNTGVVVELKAGIVGFNSSRDAILENDRYYTLENLIVKYVKSDEFMKDITSSVNSLDEDSFKEIVYSLFTAQRSNTEIENGKLIVNRNTSRYASTFAREYKYEDFKHEETGFTLNDLLQDVPNERKFTIAFRESKNTWRKTAENSVMRSDLKYSSFDEATVQLINTKIDEAISGEEDYHDLSILFMNLSSIAYNKDNQNTTVTFITGIDDENIKSIKPMRKSIIRIRNNDDLDKEYESIIVLTKYTTKEIEDSVKNLGFDRLGLEIKDAEKTIEEVKAFRASRREKSQRKTPSENLATYLEEYDAENNTTYSINPSEIDEDKHNLIIVTRSFISGTNLWSFHAWYSNENNIAPEDLNVYISRGNHRVIDLEILVELGDVFRNPNSEDVGQSKMYKEEIHNKVAKSNYVRNKDIETNEKAVLNLLTRMNGYGPESLARNIEDKLSEMYKIAKIVEFDMPEFPKEIIENILNSNDTLKLGFRNNYSATRVDNDTAELILKNIDDEYKDVVSDVSSFASERTIFIDEEGSVEMMYSGFENTSIYEVNAVFKESKTSKAFNNLEKARVKAELEFTKEVVKGLSKINFK